MPLLFWISLSNTGWQKPWLRSRSASCRYMASVRWIPSQLMYLPGSSQVDVPLEPHNKLKLKLSFPPPAPQHALKGSRKLYFVGFISIVMYAFQLSAYRIVRVAYFVRKSASFLCRIWLWIIIAEFAVAAQPVLSRS